MVVFLLVFLLSAQVCVFAPLSVWILYTGACVNVPLCSYSWVQ